MLLPGPSPCRSRGRGLPGAAIALLLALTAASGLARAVDIIANKNVAANTLSPAAARSIFGMRQAKWPDGTPIRVFVLPDPHPAHAAFCKERLNLFPYQLRQSWDRLLYSGMAQAPSEMFSEEKIIEWVAATPGAIGYVRKVKAHDAVKILSVE